MDAFSRKIIPQNTMIFEEGDIATCAYLLKSGKVEITTYHDGKRILLATILPNQIFGELALIDNSPRSATATTAASSEVIFVKPEDIERRMENLDEFMKYWVAYLTERIRNLSKRVRD